jgi:ABC-type transport system involved in multi-copper enzyme maturation permease subunit
MKKRNEVKTMTSVMICLKIAAYEAKVLLRSWGFRIFALLGLIILGLLTAGIAAPSFAFPYYFRSLSGSIPLFSFKLFNIYQGIIVVFMATEFFKRDRRTDSTQVIFSRSFSNTSYLLGKFFGVIGLFVLMNILVGVITALIHLFLSETPLSIQAYLLYFLALTLPTLVFLIGLSFVLAVVIRSQAAVILLGLAISSLSLVALGNKVYFIPDIFGFHTPLMYSDFIGLGNGAQLFQLRLPFVLLGLGFVFGTVLLAKRLQQSPWTTALSGALSSLLILSALGLILSHIQSNRDIDSLRRDFLAESQKYAEVPALIMESCSLDVEFSDSVLSASSAILLKNSQDSPAESLLLTLNPGLKISRVTTGGRDVDFSREGHILLIQLSKPVSPGENIDIQIDYAGTPIEAYCYLDIGREALRKPSKLGLFRVPKKYIFLSEKFIHLTPESGWYPRAGIPLSHRFPGAVAHDFSQYALRVSLPEGRIAASQGLPEIKKSNGRKIYTFHPITPLPQISLTVGPFEEKTLRVKDVEYKLFSLPGHGYYKQYLDAITEELPKTITQLKDEFEVTLGLDYPYDQLALVEVPIQFFSHKRLWSAADETVQPQMAFLPEMGTLCQGADFAFMNRMMQRRGRFMGRGGAEITPAQIQNSLFTRFVRNNLLGSQPQMGGFRDTSLSSVTESDVEAQYNLIPNYFTFTSTLASDRWPILHSAMESWLQDRISAASFRFYRSGGLTDQERTNMLLDGHSLTELLEGESLDDDQLNDVILAKGKNLMTIIESRIQEDNFDERLLSFIKEKKFSTIKEEDFLQFLHAYKEFDLEPVMAAWYAEKKVPAFTVGAVGMFNVRSGEQQRTHVQIPISNISESEGVVRISMMAGRGGRGGFGGGAPSEIERTVLIPPNTTKEVGVLLDSRPMMLTVDTTISRNIPAAMNLFMMRQRTEDAETFFEGERTLPYEEDQFETPGEYIVDNEDPGFTVAGSGGDNRLRSAISRLFDRSRAETEYLDYNPTNPPGRWSPVIQQDFYGKVLRTGYMIKVGVGSNKVSWTVNLPESGNYDVYFYNETMSFGGGRGPGRGQRDGDRGGRRRPTQEEKHFIVRHEDGTEEIAFDIQESPQGWVLLGTFRLAAGTNTIEQTDKGKGAFLTADAVKWVRASQK